MGISGERSHGLRPAGNLWAVRGVRGRPGEGEWQAG